MIPTAEEFARREYDDDRHIDEFAERQIDMKHALWMMQAFAKLHVQAALKVASEKAEIKIKDNYNESYSLVKSETVNYNSVGVYNVYPEECTKHRIEVFENSILEAYPLTNIK